MFDKLRADFPFFRKHPELIYFDNAATTQKPYGVLDAALKFYAYENAPVHRALYPMAEDATERYEDARGCVARSIQADEQGIAFVSGATAASNMIAYGWAAHALREGDEIVIGSFEHHACLLVWQQLAREKKLVIRWLTPTEDYSFDYEGYEAALSERTKVVVVSASSHVFGVPVDVKRIAHAAHRVGARIAVDASQYVAHAPCSVKDIDFLFFSAHKMFALNGVGVLYVAPDLRSALVPTMFGGGMVMQVGEDVSSWLPFPACCEAGSPPVAYALALAAACEYLQRNVDYALLAAHEARLCTVLVDALEKMPHVHILGNAHELKQRGHLVTFWHEKFSAHDIALYLAEKNICVRSGHHCAQPLHSGEGIGSSVRVSFAFYNTVAEVERLQALIRAAF